MDREDARARDVLCQAFLVLTQAVPVNKISVEDIARAAGVSRRTFYNYFRDKYDLANKIFELDVAETYRQTLGSGGTYREFQEACLGRFLLGITHVRNLSSNTHGLDSWRESASRTLAELLSGHIVDQAGEAALTDRVRFHLLFFLRLSLRAMLDWEMQGKPVSVDELTDRIVTAMPEPLWGFFRRDCQTFSPGASRRSPRVACGSEP